MEKNPINNIKKNNFENYDSDSLYNEKDEDEFNPAAHGLLNLISSTVEEGTIKESYAFLGIEAKGQPMSLFA